MTLRWMEGFEGTNNATILARVYENASGAIPAVVTGPRGGSAAASQNLILRTPELVSPDANDWVIGFAFRVTIGQLNTSPAARPGVAFYNASGEQLRLEAVDASDTTKPGGIYFKWRVMRGAVELARTLERFEAIPASNKWFYFEWKVDIDTATGGSFDLRFHRPKSQNNTATWDNPNTGINTANQGVAGADRVQIAWTVDSGDQVAFDDIYVLDAAGAKNNDYLGPFFIEALDPQGDGDTTAWTLAGTAASTEDAWNEEANTQSTLEDDKRLTSDSTGAVHLCTLSNPTAIRNSEVTGVQTRAYGKMETTGSATLDAVWRKTTGTPAQTSGASHTFTSTSFGCLVDTQENDPNTATDWVVADIDGLQVGVDHSA